MDRLWPGVSEVLTHTAADDLSRWPPPFAADNPGPSSDRESSDDEVYLLQEDGRPPVRLARERRFEFVNLEATLGLDAQRLRARGVTPPVATRRARILVHSPPPSPPAEYSSPPGSPVYSPLPSLAGSPPASRPSSPLPPANVFGEDGIPVLFGPNPLPIAADCPLPGVTLIPALLSPYVEPTYDPRLQTAAWLDRVNALATFDGDIWAGWVQHPPPMFQCKCPHHWAGESPSCCSQTVVDPLTHLCERCSVAGCGSPGVVRCVCACPFCWHRSTGSSSS